MGQKQGGDAAYWMCHCRITHNYFLRAAGRHFAYDGDDAAFLEAHRGELELQGVEETLKELRRQREERLRAPEESLAPGAISARFLVVLIMFKYVLYNGFTWCSHEFIRFYLRFFMGDIAKSMKYMEGKVTKSSRDT